MRRYIESAMDLMINEAGDLVGVLKPHINGLRVKSLRDFAVGYLVGASKNMAITLILEKEVYTRRMQPISNQDKLQIDEMITQRHKAIMDRVTREEYR